MKDFTGGNIFCKCSNRMHCKGMAVKIYENTSKKKKCPNCGCMCNIKVKKGKK